MKLGYRPTDKVIVLHIDDVGMSYESNHGAIDAIEKGVAKSFSIMMPCPWVPEIFHYLKDHPKTDAGLHLTLNSEWKDYRWGPVAGIKAVPGLVDNEGAMYRSLPEVYAHATPEEVNTEIYAQLERCRKMGWEPTHLDSHMGTIILNPSYLEKYIGIAIDQHLPIQLPCGHNYLNKKTGVINDVLMNQLHSIGERLWNAGLPVFDDLHNFSYGWKPSAEMKTAKDLREFKTKKYIESFKELQPGLTYVIMHCTSYSDIFSHISDSGAIRQADMEAMMDPALKNYLDQQGIIVTTIRELTERRKAVK